MTGDPTSSRGAPSILQQAKATLTDAQIKTLPTAEVALVAAPGAGFVLLPRLIWLRCDTTAGIYTNIDAASQLRLSFAQSTALMEASSNVEKVSTFLASGVPQVAVLTGKQGVSHTIAADLLGYGQALDNYENRALALSMTNGAAGDLTGGHATVTMQVVLTYLTLDLAAGEFVAG